MTEWARIAKPQPDDYDTVKLLEQAYRRWGYGSIYSGGPRFCKFMELTNTDKTSSGEFAAINDPRLTAVEDIIRSWQHSDSLRLLDFFSPMKFDRPVGRGCTSGHSKPSERGRIGCYVTIDDPTGCAEGIVHELAHQRLHCLGMDLDSHDRTLILNDNELKWFSPIRRDCLRPMTALIHGIYAYTFVLSIDLIASDGIEYLKNNVPKVRRGLEEISKGVEVTDEGVEFMKGFLEWAYSLVHEGEATLLNAGVAEVYWEGYRG